MDWQKKVSLWWAKNFRPLVVALLVGCGVHYTIYANQLGTMDAVHIGALYIADGWPEHLYWETEQGRWRCAWWICCAAASTSLHFRHC
ncbi:hypothetical protein [Gemmiger sp.]|uniref:hypothetical protein n=1 Tax=Gemmiger sp. TaxID=2049027 RepID=UPI002F9483D8